MTTRKTAKGATEIDAPKTATEIDGLEEVTVSQLQAKFAEVVGETTRSPNRTYAEPVNMRSSGPEAL